MCVCERQRDRETERERERERQTDRERQRETETQRERGRQRDRQTDKQTERQRDREEREIHTDTDTDRQTQRHRESVAPCIAVEVNLHVWSTGGYIVNVTRTEHLENCKDYVGRLEPLMAKLEAMGRWKEFNRVIFPNFLRGKEGVAIIHRVL